MRWLASHLILIGSFKPHLHDTTCCQWDVKPYSVSQLSNRFNNRLNVSIHDAPGCHTGLTNRLYRVQPVVQPILTTGWMNSGCSLNRLYNQFDNQLYRVYSRLCNPVWQAVERTVSVPSAGCQTGCTAGFTTGCFVRSCVFLHWNVWTVFCDA